MRSIIADIEKVATSGLILPKPEAKADFRVKKWGMRRGERALVYLIPNHTNPQKPHEKGITESEFQRAYERLMQEGEFSHQWFNQHMSECASEGDCNFTTIGGIFQLLGVAEYQRAKYIRK